MIKLIKPYKDNKEGEILSLGCVEESKLIKKKIAVKLKLPSKDYAVKS